MKGRKEKNEMEKETIEDKETEKKYRKNRRNIEKKK